MDNNVLSKGEENALLDQLIQNYSQPPPKSSARPSKRKATTMEPSNSTLPNSSQASALTSSSLTTSNVRTPAVAIPSGAFLIDPDIYIDDIFETFVAPSMNNAIRTRYYRKLFRDLTRKDIRDRFPIPTPENIYTSIVDVLNALALLTTNI